MLDLKDFRSTSTAKIIVNFQGAPDTEWQYSSPVRTFEPDEAAITYEYDAASQWWGVTHVAVSGYRVLKPGKNGERRIGQERGIYEWYSFSGVLRESLPEWLSRLTEEVRPTGALGLPTL